MGYFFCLITLVSIYAFLPRIKIICFFYFKRYQIPQEVVDIIHSDFKSQSSVKAIVITDITSGKSEYSRRFHATEATWPVVESMIPKSVSYLGEHVFDFGDGIKIYSSNGLVVLFCKGYRNDGMVVSYEGYLLGRYILPQAFIITRSGDTDVTTAIRALEK